MASRPASFLGPPIALTARATRQRQMLAAAADLGDAANGDEFGLEMMGQEQTNWCWAAVTQAVRSHAEGHLPRQEDVATAHIQAGRPGSTCAPPWAGQTNGGLCRPGQCSAACNNVHEITVVLGEQGYACAVLGGGPPSFSAIQQAVRDRNPIICRVGVGNAGHYICVSGWWTGEGRSSVLVYDPWDARPYSQVRGAYMPYDEFSSNYRAGGHINIAWAVRR